MSARVLTVLALVLALANDAASLDATQSATPIPTVANASLAARLEEHVCRLARDIGQRNLDNYKGLVRARDYIAEQLRTSGYIPELQTFAYREETFDNVEAVLPATGSAPTCLVIGAHYDSVEGSPGANDNASGVAVLLELARALRGQKLNWCVRFVAFANEEPPYFNTGDGMGSVEYVRRLGPVRHQIRAMFSIETVGYFNETPGSQHYPPLIGALYPDKGNFIGFVGNLSSRKLVQASAKLFRESRAALPIETATLPAAVPGISWSDHRSFWEADIDAMMVTDTATFRDPHYHRLSDTPERLDYAKMAELVRGLEYIALHLPDELQ